MHLTRGEVGISRRAPQTDLEFAQQPPAAVAPPASARRSDGPDAAPPRQTPLRIAIEAWAAVEVPAGRGRYVRELLRALARLDGEHEFVLLCRFPGEELGPRMRWRVVPGSGRSWTVRAARVASREADVLFAPTSYAIAALARVPSVTVVHDLVAFDRSLHPPPGAQFERLTLPLAARRARTLLCTSHATRDALLARHPRVATRAVVTHLGASERFSHALHDPAVLARHGIGRPFVLAAATREPRKNLVRLIAAFAALPAGLRDGHELVLVGDAGWAARELDAALRRHADCVRVLGYVGEGELVALYSQATAVAYPSLKEGFGLPVLEAMAAGAPVLTSDRSSMPEVAGDAALFCDPTDVDSIRAGLQQLLSDPLLRLDLAARGRERAASFTWERTARATLAALTA